MRSSSSPSVLYGGFFRDSRHHASLFLCLSVAFILTEQNSLWTRPMHKRRSSTAMRCNGCLKRTTSAPIAWTNFLEALPGYIHSQPTGPRSAIQSTASYITQRITAHFSTYATSYWLSDEACVARVSACIDCFQLILKSVGKHPAGGDKVTLQKICMEHFIVSLNGLCNGEDRKVALRASCIRSLAFQDFVSHLTTPD